MVRKGIINNQSLAPTGLATQATLANIYTNTQAIQTAVLRLASRYSSSAYEAIISAGITPTGTGLTGIFGYNSKSSDQFIQLHDSVLSPADGAVPILTLIARANDNFFFGPGDLAVQFSNKIWVCNSSTGPTKTIGSADCFFTILYY